MSTLPLLLLSAVLGLGSTPLAVAAPVLPQTAERAGVPAKALGLSDVTGSSTATPTGTRVTATFTVGNRTAEPVPASRARLFLVSQDGSRTFGLEAASVPRLAPGETRRISRTKAPNLRAVAGRYRLRVCLAPRPGGPCRTSSTATVRIAPPRLVPTPGSVSFGDTEAGTKSASRRVVVRNEGQSVTGDLTVTVTGPDASDFLWTSSCGSLSPGQTCATSVDFAPTSAGAKNASLDVTGARPGAATGVALTGDAIAAPAPASLAIDPTSSDFGVVDPGGSTTRTFTVTNTGGVASGPVLAFLDRPVPFSITASTCAAPLPAQGTCTVDVQFTPITFGAASALLAVTGTPGGTASATLSGTGRQVGARLVISPGSHDFGTVPAGQQSAPQQFTVTNTGDTATGRLTTLIGPPGGFQQFLVTGDTCTSLAPRASCVVTVVYRPASFALIADGFVGVADFQTGTTTPLARLTGRSGSGA